MACYIYCYGFLNGGSKYNKHLHNHNILNNRSLRENIISFTKNKKLLYRNIRFRRCNIGYIHSFILLKKNNIYRWTFYHRILYDCHWILYRLRKLRCMSNIHVHSSNIILIHNWCNILDLCF